MHNQRQYLRCYPARAGVSVGGMFEGFEVPDETPGEKLGDNIQDVVRSYQLKTQLGISKDLKKLQQGGAGEEAHMAKCPWCAGPIEDNVFKCRHCASDIEWVNVGSLQPCRPQDKPDLIDQHQKEQRQKLLQRQIRQRKSRAAENEYVRCPFCNCELKRKNLHNGACQSCYEARNPPPRRLSAAEEFGIEVAKVLGWVALLIAFFVFVVWIGVMLD